MSNDQDSLAKTKNLDEINKNKKLISKIQYGEQQGDCQRWIFIPAFFSFMGSVFILPYALKSVPRLTISSDVRLLTGLLSALPISYLVLKRSKERCEKRVDDTYYYKI